MISQPLTIIRTNKIGKPYVQATDPSLSNTLSANDLWLNPSNGTMKTWDGTAWVEMQFGESAIMDNCITNRVLANGISASKITAGILQSQDGSFYLNLESGEAELLNLILGGQVEGNIVAESSNGLTRVRLRGKEGERDTTAGIIFEEREDNTDEAEWENAGQIYFGYTSRSSCASVKIYQIGPYNGSRPNMGYNAGTHDGLMWRMLATDWLTAGYYTFHGARIAKRSSISDTFANINPVITAIGDIMTGTSVVGNGIATCTYKFNDVMQIDFNIKITTAGTGTGTYGISTALLRTLNAEIPALTPMDGGTLQIYTTTGAAVVSNVGQTLKADGNYWTPSYINSGAITKFTEADMSLGITLIGTCYAQYSYDEEE